MKINLVKKKIYFSLLLKNLCKMYYDNFQGMLMNLWYIGFIKKNLILKKDTLYLLKNKFLIFLNVVLNNQFVSNVIFLIIYHFFLAVLKY